MRQNSGFTLVEVLVAVALTGMILLTGYSTFQRIMQTQSRLGAAIDVQKNLFYTNEKIAALIRAGGTIDYEEYFNRRMLGYTRDRPDFNGDSSLDNLYTFTTASHFGNGNNTTLRPPIYYCGVPSTGEQCLGENATYIPPSGGLTTLPGPHQPYGQYTALAYNYLDPVGFPMPIALPPIFPADTMISIAKRGANGVVSWENKKITEVGLPELYLIKKNLDNTYTRTYFRHVYVQDPFTIGSKICDPSSNPTNPLNGCLGKIQMTKLESCDTAPEDGTIDAWIPACEFNISSPLPNCTDLVTYRSTTCPNNQNDIYTSAHEEALSSGTIPPNLTWVDVTAPDMHVVRATFLPSPLKIPTLMSGAGEAAESPVVSVSLEVELSTKLRNQSFIRTNMNYPRTLTTTYDLSE